jgi:SSS family transporter
LGIVGFGYVGGYSALWFSIGSIAGNLIAVPILAPRLRQLSKKTGALTLPDFLMKRFNSKSVLIITAALLVLLYIPFMVSQIKGGGVIFASMGLAYEWGVVIFGLITMVYVMVAGLYSVVYSDFIQGWIMLIGTLVMTPFILNMVGGFDAMNAAYAAANPKGWTPWGPFGLITILGLFFSMFIGSLARPHSIIQFMAAKSENDLRRSYLIFIAANAFIVPIVMIWGIAGRVLLPGIQADMSLPLLITNFLPPIVGGFIFISLIAAILSTVNTILLISGGAVANDIYKTAINPKVSEKRALIISRLIIVAVMVVTIILSLWPPELLATWIAWTMGGMGVLFFILLYGGIYWKRMNKESALAGIISSMVSFGVWTALRSPFGIDASIIAVVIGIPVTIITAYLTPKPPKEIISTFFERA